MRCDLHIHTALSPCADDDMTPNNIVNMALLCDLQLIAVSDHNTLKQCDALAKAAHGKIKFLYGVEMQSKEEVHVLGYFKDRDMALKMQAYLDEHLEVIDNDVNYFGHQLLYNEHDEVLGEEKRLLLSSLDVSVETLCKKVHELHGAFVLAHALDRSSSIITQLGFIPLSLPYDAIEVKDEQQQQMIMKTHPWIKGSTIWLYNSDAHTLGDIGTRKGTISDTQLKRLWRLCI